MSTAAYRKSHTNCEKCGRRAIEIHHILGRNFPECDSPENLLAVNRPCHDKFGRTREGKIAGLHLKMQLNQETFSLRWFDERVGYCLSGKLENWLAEVDEYHQRLIRELLANESRHERNHE